MFTEKERQIINALIEEELTYAINHGDINDVIIASYSDTLAKILMKMNEGEPRAPKNRCFDFVRDSSGVRQPV